MLQSISATIAVGLLIATVDRIKTKCLQQNVPKKKESGVDEEMGRLHLIVVFSQDVGWGLAAFHYNGKQMGF